MADDARGGPRGDDAHDAWADDAWADDEWADDEWPGDEWPGDDAGPAPIVRFQRSGFGTVFAAGLLGLRDVFEPPKDEQPAIVEDWSGGEPFADPYVLRLDPDNPADSIVMVRRHLQDRPPSG